MIFKFISSLVKKEISGDSRNIDLINALCFFSLQTNIKLLFF